MKVIVAGFPKTGTKSMNWALTQLGHKVYDFPEHYFVLYEDYKKVFSEGWTTNDFRRMYEGVDAVVDNPACFFWEELHEAFPDAKIILTMRKDEDEWFRSLQKLFAAMDTNITLRLLEILSPTYRRATRDVFDRTGEVSMGWMGQSVFRRKSHLNEQMLKRGYRAHNAYVMHIAPKDKLLVYECSEGWEPLCEFLGVNVPDAPFPHKNKAGSVVNEAMKTNPVLLRIQRELLLASIFIAASTFTVGYYMYKLGPMGLCTSITNFATGLAKKLHWT